jgi:predicted ATPase
MIESLAASVTYLFSDIEGSTRLWEADPACASRTVAWHDEVSRSAVQLHHGTVVKTTGDGLHAVFDDPADAVAAVIELQLALADPAPGCAPIRLRCGLHVGTDERRDNDFYGQAVNRAARIMSAAHGGQVLLSGALAERLAGRLPPGVTLRDLGAVRLRDLGSPERLYQVVHPALRADFPPLRSMASTPNNLTQQLNSFIGRDREMEQVRQLLASSRLLTLLGMGGLGKSRLSMQVAAIVLEDYPDGVWFVELAALSDPNLVPQAVASVLGVREEPGGTLMDALVRHVRDRKLLLVLDNCEHLVHECADVAKRLLQAGPQVRVLASSRDSLSVAGETVFHVTPLPVPGSDATATPDGLMRLESVRLFVDRATAAQPSFRLNARNAAAVAEICRRLDGIPLAIELAAARTRAMSVETIAARLQDRFRLLTSRDRTVLPRQQTLRALIDWSYDMLPAKERTLLQRLSVFAGGWTLEAAESVCSGDPIGRDELIDLLGNLVEKSLVLLDPDSNRYRMLETVRQYAAEQLGHAADASAARSRHLSWCLELAHGARDGFVGPDAARWLTALDAERENMLAAHRWCDEADDGAALGLQLTHALKLYWYQRGLLTLGHRVTFEALARVPAAERSAQRCTALADVGQFCSFMGRLEEAQRCLEESLAIARELGDRNRIAAAVQSLGYACQTAGDLGRARQLFDEGVELARDVGDTRQIAAALICLGQLLRQQRDFGGAEQLYREATDIARRLGDEESVGIGLLNLAMVAIECGRLQEARPLLRDAVVTALATGSQMLGQAALDVMSGYSAADGHMESCAHYYGASEAQAVRSGLQRDPTDAGFLMPRLEAARAQLGDRFALLRDEGTQWSCEDALRRAVAELS